MAIGKPKSILMQTEGTPKTTVVAVDGDELLPEKVSSSVITHKDGTIVVNVVVWSKKK